MTRCQKVIEFVEQDKESVVHFHAEWSYLSFCVFSCFNSCTRQPLASLLRPPYYAIGSIPLTRRPLTPPWRQQRQLLPVIQRNMLHTLYKLLRHQRIIRISCIVVIHANSECSVYAYLYLLKRKRLH